MKSKFIQSTAIMPFLNICSLLLGSLMVLFYLFVYLPAPPPTTPKSFREAKRVARKIFINHPSTFYCNCNFDENGNIDLKNCGYVAGKYPKRAQHIEFEHIMPAHHFGKNLPCWRKFLCTRADGSTYRGRQCCQKIDVRFQRMEADLHNIVPAVGEINQARSNYSFAELPHFPAGQYGKCPIKIDARHHLVEPQAPIRGLIARAYLYMSVRYNIPLQSQEFTLFHKWNAEYPVSAWEQAWNKEVTHIQGNPNTLIH